MTDRDKVIDRLKEVSEFLRAKADIAQIGKGREVFDSWFRAVEDARALLREWQQGGDSDERETPSRMALYMGGADMYMAFLDDETLEDAEDRLLEQLADAGVDLIGWNAAETRLETYDVGEAGEND